jgi:hypothetical protein
LEKKNATLRMMIRLLSLVEKRALLPVGKGLRYLRDQLGLMLRDKRPPLNLGWYYQLGLEGHTSIKKYLKIHRRPSHT